MNMPPRSKLGPNNSRIHVVTQSSSNYMRVCSVLDEISVDCLDFNKKILHTAWHPHESIIAVAATNNLFIFQDKF
ncbi:Serine/threonine-protein phosphatase 2A 55 kDa regulatory subunit B [Operophtera brumata]|uniref:Serine/threonine-protein phosphatase 2A 55 kDa regulatory subunit B n=1 Tax=Operophtera brumata TaxID=104452 RepID=A0A0L7L7K0_OPEBR|nr:Serine/threonine-protein phosphatase 2A 55 kDa regulatory subunit B [Operophtera brumata]